MSNASLLLAGRVIAIPETRELDLLASMLEEKGATPLRCPLVAILDAADPAPVLAWIEQTIAEAFDDVIFYTGEGVRRLAALAERHDRRGAFVAALGRVRKITRGPKPGKALRELGLAPDLPALQPTTAGLIELLRHQPLHGRRIGLQLYDANQDMSLADVLTAGGADVSPVAPYCYAPKSDDDRVQDLVRQLTAGSIAGIAFTSASQVDRLFDVASDKAALTAGLGRIMVAAVGPVVAAKLTAVGVTVHVAPTASYFLRPLVNAIVDHFQTQAPL